MWQIFSVSVRVLKSLCQSAQPAPPTHRPPHSAYHSHTICCTKRLVVLLISQKDYRPSAYFSLWQSWSCVLGLTSCFFFVPFPGQFFFVPLPLCSFVPLFSSWLIFYAFSWPILNFALWFYTFRFKFFTSPRYDSRDTK